MYRPRCAALAVLFAASFANVFAQDGTARRIDEGVSLPDMGDGVPRFREDTGWDTSNYDVATWAVEYGNTLRSTPWAVVLQSDRTNAAFTAGANQLTLDLAGHTHFIKRFLNSNGDPSRIKSFVVSDRSGSTTAYLKVANGTFHNASTSNVETIIGETGQFGKLIVENGEVLGAIGRIGVYSGSSGVVLLETGGRLDFSSRLEMGNYGAGSIDLRGVGSFLAAQEIVLGSSGGHGSIVLRDPTSTLLIRRVGTAGNLKIANGSSSGSTPGLRVIAGTVTIGQNLELATKNGSTGIVSIEGGTVKVGGVVKFVVSSGGKILLRSGRLETAGPAAFMMQEPGNFSWETGTLAFSGPDVVVTDANLRMYTTQGAIDYGNGRAAGVLAADQTLEAAGTMTLSGGTVGIAGGTLRAGMGLVVNAPLEGYGTLDAVVGGTGSITNTTAAPLVAGALAGSNTIYSDGELIVGSRNVDAAFAGTSDGAGTFTKVGTATQTVTGLVANAGGVDVRQGTLAFSGAGSRIATGPVDIDAGATLRLAGGATGTATSVEIAGGGGAPSRLEIVDAGSVLQVAGSLTNGGWIDLTGGTLAVDGTLVNHGRLINNGTLDAVVSGSGILTGSGTFAGPVTLDGGATLAPGQSPGTVSVADLTLGSGGVLQLELASASGTAGADWDLVAVTDALTIAATAANPFVIALTSLDGSFQGGLLDGFDPAQAYSWKFLDTFLTDPEAIDLAALQLDASAFTAYNDVASGSFSLVAASDGLSVEFSPQVTAAPEPTSWFLLGVSGTIAGLVHWRRRRAPAKDIAA